MRNDDVLPRLWARAARTKDPDDRVLLLEAAQVISDLRSLFEDEDELAYKLGVRSKPKG